MYGIHQENVGQITKENMDDHTDAEVALYEKLKKIVDHLKPRKGRSNQDQDNTKDFDDYARNNRTQHHQTTYNDFEFNSVTLSFRDFEVLQISQKF
jgi:hypothetical protein